MASEKLDGFAEPPSEVIVDFPCSVCIAGSTSFQATGRVKPVTGVVQGYVWDGTNQTAGTNPSTTAGTEWGDWTLDFGGLPDGTGYIVKAIYNDPLDPASDMCIFDVGIPTNGDETTEVSTAEAQPMKASTAGTAAKRLVKRRAVKKAAAKAAPVKKKVAAKTSKKTAKKKTAQKTATKKKAAKKPAKKKSAKKKR